MTYFKIRLNRWSDHESQTFSNIRYFPPGRDTVILSKKIRQEIVETINSDAETLAQDTSFLKSNIDGIVFENASYRTSEKAHSGKYSIETNHNNTHGFYIKLSDIKPCDRNWFHVWRYPARSPVAVVAASEDLKKYYEAESNQIVAEEEGWGLLVKEFVIPNDYSENIIVIFLANYLEPSVWFDDVEIKRTKPLD